MNIVIRTDASLLIGSGHVMRCLVLANALTVKGFTLYFAMRPQPGDLIEFVTRQGFEVLILPALKVPSEDHTWLGVSSTQDADDLCAILACRQDLFVNAVVVDHYGIDQQWETMVTQRFGCKMVVMDDVVRDHDAHLVIDQTIHRSPDEYALTNMHPNAFNATGADYALLKPKFAQLHQHITFTAPILSQLPAKTAILVAMGGVDLDNVTLTVLKALHPISAKSITVTVLLSRQSPHFDIIAMFCAQHSDWLTHTDFIADMPQLISQHTIGIGAAGTSALERACLGLPSIIIPIADNQRTIANELHQARAALIVESPNIMSHLSNSLHTLQTHYSQFHQNGLTLTDGLGTNRVVTLLDQLLRFDGVNIVLRRATHDDIQQVYQWQCLPQTRQFALEPSIPSWEEHEQWMRLQLDSFGDYFYIIERVKDTEPVGVVRMDRKGVSSYQISIYVAPEFHHQGIASAALACIDEIHNNAIIFATVLTDNIASQQLFRRANYQRVAPDKFIRQSRVVEP
jgi:UDP-2,4-diacetamido-2,4,6-trideoxy-beta-L-altropyranose hydrolase